MNEVTKCKLFYFPIKALAEPIRFLLAYGGIEFEDVRIGKEQWKTFKEKTPFGQVPVLEVDGRVMHQSVSICRFLGNQMELTGVDALENAEIDAMVDSISDLRAAISKYNREASDSANKEVLREELLEGTIPFYLSRFDKAANDGFMALGRLTWADLYFIGLLDYFNGVMKVNVVNGYKNLEALQMKVYNLEAIKEWINKRPISDY